MNTNQRRLDAEDRDEAHRDNTRRLETALSQRQADKEIEDLKRQRYAQILGTLTEQNLLVGIPISALAIWMQRQKDAKGRALDESLVEWQRQHALEVRGVAGLGDSDGNLNAAGADQAAAFLSSVTMADGRSALDAWTTAHEANRPATPRAPTLLPGRSVVDELRARVEGSGGDTRRHLEGPSY